MNKQRKVVITTTYNEMGIIIDTKAEEVAQPNLQPTCNNLATDTISRRAAVDAICGECQANCIPCESFPCGEIKVLQTLTSAQQERLTDDDFEIIPTQTDTSNTLKALDCVERQAAIDALKGLPTWWADEAGYYGGAQPPMVALLRPEDAVSSIENLPSAQPEIIRCKDCKHFETDYWFNSILIHEICARWEGGVKPDGYCFMAERREE